MSTISENLRHARRQIDRFQQLSIVRDLQPVGNERCWSFAFDLKIAVPQDSPIPPVTRWWIVLSSDYPWGSLEVYPDAINGIRATFPHQSCNLPPLEGQYWRQGKLCLRSPNQIFQRRYFGQEPLGEPCRLGWYINRMLCWIDAAINGTLFSDDDPFELPDFDPRRPFVVWSESDQSWQTWRNIDLCYGIANICFHKCRLEKSDIIVVRSFSDTRGNEVLKYVWGDYVNAASGNSIAAWIKLSQTPYIEPYQAPLTWGEFRSILKKMNISFDECMRRSLHPLRGEQNRLLLIGFPIPKTYGGALELMHWQAIRLPPLSHDKCFRAGFRSNAMGYWKQDCFKYFRGCDSIEWLNSRNWHPEQLSGRGVLMSKVISKNITIIGAGAVGCVLSEMLVRSGIRNISIIDDDILEGGNLVRHILTLDDLKKNKAEAMASRMKRLLPNISVNGFAEEFPSLSDDASKSFFESDAIIDCSGDDGVARALSDPRWNNQGLYISLSLGYEASRCYIYVAPQGQYSLNDLESKAKPWLDIDQKKLNSAKLPAEATGCWHPLFPARVDNIWGMIGLAVSEIEKALANIPPKPILIVLEKKYDNENIVIERSFVE